MEFFSMKTILFAFQRYFFEKGINAQAHVHYTNLNIYLPLLIFIASDERNKTLDRSVFFCTFFKAFFCNSQCKQLKKEKKDFFITFSMP